MFKYTKDELNSMNGYFNNNNGFRWMNYYEDLHKFFGKDLELLIKNQHLVPSLFCGGAQGFFDKLEEVYVKHHLDDLAKKALDPQSNKKTTIFYEDFGKDFALKVAGRCEKVLNAYGFKVLVKTADRWVDLSICGTIGTKSV